MKIDYNELSKILSHALRHEPEKYGLKLDEGWCDVNDLLNSLKQVNLKWKELTLQDLKVMIDNSRKKRHELLGDKIRAVYGHSLTERIEKKASMPPVFLFHGTTGSKAKQIFTGGLKPMERQYVHLTEKIEEAKLVAERWGESEIEILKIESYNAHLHGINFYKEKNSIWLADTILSKYISSYESK